MVVAQFLAALQKEFDWPISAVPEESGFCVSPSDLGFARHERSAIREVWQLRLPPGDGWIVYLLDFGRQPINRWLVRRVLMYALNPSRSTGRVYSRWKLDQVLFLCLAEGRLSVCHFSGNSTLKAPMATLGPFDVQRVDVMLAWENRDRWADLFVGRYEHFGKKQYRFRHSPEHFERVSEGLADLARYASGFERPDHDEELALVGMMRDGNKQARERLILAHLDIALEAAARRAARYPEARVPLEDLVSWAIEGLVRGVELHDPALGGRVQVHVWRWVSRNVDRGLVLGWYPIDVPVYVWERLRNVIKDYDLLVACHEYQVRFDCSPVTFGERYDLDEADCAVVELLEDSLRDESYADELVVDNDWEDELAARYGLKRRLSRGGHREVQVLLMRLGLDPSYPGQRLTLGEIGALMDISRERVRQIELRAHKWIRAATPCAGPDDPLPSLADMRSGNWTSS